MSNTMINLKKVFTSCFEIWWRPILFWAFALGLIVLSKIISVDNYFDNVSYSLLAIALSGLIFSVAYQLIKGHWIRAFLTGFLFAGTVGAFILFGLFMLFIEIVDGDKWADNLIIPENIALHIPKEAFAQTRSDSIINLERSKSDFELYNSFQPGLYEYDLWINEIESGTVYLKAFEITQEYQLSTDRLPEQSSIKINNPTNKTVKFGTNDHFTIYEGDWGKPYAARFEIWFKPDNNFKERKLLEKIYKIEGWMR